MYPQIFHGLLGVSMQICIVSTNQKYLENIMIRIEPKIANGMHPQFSDFFAKKHQNFMRLHRSDVVRSIIYLIQEDCSEYSAGQQRFISPSRWWCGLCCYKHIFVLQHCCYGRSTGLFWLSKAQVATCSYMQARQLHTGILRNIEAPLETT